MKDIIKLNPNNHIESFNVGKADIILVYRDNAPIGYVHNTDGMFKLYVNYLFDLVEDVAIEEIPYGFRTLEKMIDFYSELQFKLID